VLARAADGYRAHRGARRLALRPDHFIHIGISRRFQTRRIRARIPGGLGPGTGRQWVNSERRKNGAGFPVSVASHQRFVADSARFGGSRQQLRKNANKKAGARPAFSDDKTCN
jgi:hypothetical protein